MQAILFDLDDTLFDHRYSTRAGLAAVQEQYQLPGGVDELEERYRHLLEAGHLRVLDGSRSVAEARVERFQAFLSDGDPVDEEKAQSAVLCYRAAYEAAQRVVPGALELLEALQGSAKIGIVSNHVEAAQVRKVTELEIAPLIDELVVSEEVGVTKPDRLIFDVALRRLGSSASDAVMVGDSWPADIVGATQAGLRAVWMNRYGDACPDPTMAVEIDSFEPLQDIVRLIRG